MLVARPSILPGSKAALDPQCQCPHLHCNGMVGIGHRSGKLCTSRQGRNAVSALTVRFLPACLMQFLEENIVKLNKFNFDDNVKHGVWFVKFYASRSQMKRRGTLRYHIGLWSSRACCAGSRPWCTHCQRWALCLLACILQQS